MFYRTISLLLLLAPLSASNAYELLPQGKVGLFSEEVREQVVSTRQLVASYCDHHFKVLDVFDRLLLTMAFDGAFEEGTGNFHRLLESIHFAAYYHRSQIRKCPERLPYIIHPIGVAYLLWVEGGVRDEDTLMAAVLHDTVEDTDAGIEDVEGAFGSAVASIVAEVTDDKSLSFEERKRYQVVHAPYLSYEAKLVKLADKLYNVRDTVAVVVWAGDRAYPWSEERARAYVLWAQSVVEGLRGTNEALETRLDETFEWRLAAC